MPRADEGFQSEALRAALRDALAGRPAELERLLARNGAVVLAKPNLKLAAAFGAEVAGLPGNVGPLLSRLGGDDAAPDTDRAFLPIAAAHGWAARLRAGREVEAAWAALAELAADERAPVRIGARDALALLTNREGDTDELVARGLSWLDADDRELRFGSSAMLVEVLGEKRVLALVRDREQLLDYLGRALSEVADANRSAERSDGRRRLLLSLPKTLAAVVAQFTEAHAWLEIACSEADRPDVRKVLSDALVKLRTRENASDGGVVGHLQRTLEASAKPLRDPSRLRPGTGRGKASRRTR
jgi:hypothetical protein